MFCRKLVLVLLAFAGGAAGAGEFRIYTPARAYVVSVAPVDLVSRDAESSLLYQRAGDAREWVELGVCEKTALRDGDVRFTREVEVGADGVYHYTSRPVVGGRVESPPAFDSPAQATVVVDTVAPEVEIVEPVEGFTTGPGRNARVSWNASDDNFGDGPVAVSYTSDGGKSWNPVARDLPASGDFDWLVPDFLAGPVILRVAAADSAGNVGRAMRGVEVEMPRPVVPPALPPVPAPPRPAETIVDRPAAVEEPAKAEEPEKAAEPVAGIRDPDRAWLYYLMAINLMRQNKPADALQYYWLSVKADPEFVDAWADIGLAYIDLGAYRTARDVVEKTRDLAPERIDLMHLLGETYHAEGMALLGKARTSEERMRAKGLVDRAVGWYGEALEKAAEDWRLSEQAPSYYRLGEVCYFVNMDRDGARAYWRKILELHSPTPNPDLVLWSPESERNAARRRHERHTYRRVSLDAWQNWARGYLEQMDARERMGVVDLMPAQRIAAVPELAYAGNAVNPGRDDGRSLFSLPGQLGSPSPVAAAEASSTPESRRRRDAGAAAGEYTFYAPKNDPRATRRTVPPARRSGASMFSGGPDRPQEPDPDPYAFPQGGRERPEWYGMGAYGDRPAPGF